MQPTFASAWKSPSNIAFIKYWGKKTGQLPANPSLSMSLTEAFTDTQVFSFTKGPGFPAITLNGNPAHLFLGKISGLLSAMLADYPVLANFSYQIETQNSFPHSTGIASSASGLSAFALCMLDIAWMAAGRESGTDDFFQRASFYARLGSGSACRSLYPGYTAWGKSAALPGSSDDYAIPVNDKIHRDFLDLHDTILIVSSEPKAVSSTAGHAKMTAHPFADARILQAENNMSDILISLEKGDFDAFGKVAESEALTLHSLIMTAETGTILLEAGSLQIIKAIREGRKQGFPVFFTIDAGPNIHLVYPGNQANKVKTFIQQELLPYCENQKVIYDTCGQGPSRIPAEHGFLG
jgi:diphosphomevalonate decarboxylase